MTIEYLYIYIYINVYLELNFVNSMGGGEEREYSFMIFLNFFFFLS